MISLGNWVICRKSEIEWLRPGYSTKDIRYPLWKQGIKRIIKKLGGSEYHKIAIIKEARYVYNWSLRFAKERVEEVLREMNR